MASNHIDLQGNESRHAAMLRGAVDELRRLQDSYRKLAAIMAEIGAGGLNEAENNGYIQAAYGLANGDEAATVKGLVADVNGVLQNNNKVTSLLNRLG